MSATMVTTMVAIAKQTMRVRLILRYPSLSVVQTHDIQPAVHPLRSAAAQPRAGTGVGALSHPNRTRRALESYSPSPGILLPRSWAPRHAPPPGPNQLPTSNGAGSRRALDKRAESAE